MKKTISYVTKDHRAYTKDDTKLITDLQESEREAVFTWIRLNILPGDAPLKGCSSYGIKHILGHDMNLYLSNNQFKDAMLICGYDPVDSGTLNWMYRISRESPAFMLRRLPWNPREKPAAANDSLDTPCFYHWLLKKYREEDSPRGDLARDAALDHVFYSRNTRAELLLHLEMCGACNACLDVLNAVGVNTRKQFAKIKSRLEDQEGMRNGPHPEKLGTPRDFVLKKPV